MYTHTDTEFKDAKTLQEAKEYANRFCKDGKSRFFNTIRLENLNQFNRQMTHLTEKYNYNDFWYVGSYVNPCKTSNAHAYSHFIELEAEYGSKSKKGLKEMFDDEVTNYGAGTGKFITMKKNYILSVSNLIKQNPDSHERGKWILQIKDASKLIKQLKEDIKYSRYSVIYSAEDHIKDVVTHEFGHVLMRKEMEKEIHDGGYNSKHKFNLKEKDTKTFSIVFKTFNQAIESGDIYKISWCSRVNCMEFFAECFVIYEEDREQLPEYIKNMIEFALKI